MEDNETRQIEEYLRIKKIEEEDKSEELVDEIYEKIMKENLEMKQMKGK